MKISDISVRRPSIVMVVFIVLTLFGILSYFSLNYELLPKFSPNMITVSTVYPGASPGEVESTVTKKLEEAVGTMENIKKIEATSYESLSVLLITLTDDADGDFSLNDAQRKINQVLADLPDDAKTPSLVKMSVDDLPIMTLSATSKIDDIAFFDLMDKKIQPSLSQIKGVAEVTLIGGIEREIRVSVNPRELEAQGLSLLQVQQAIGTGNMDFPTGSIKSDRQDMLVRLAGKFESVDDLRELVVVNTSGGGQILLKDIADIQDIQKETEKIARVNHKNSIAVQITKQSDANAVEVSKLTQQLIQQLHQEYEEEGLQLAVANDSSDYTLESANAVMVDLVFAIILVGLIMLLFLHSFRNALIVMIAIPLSLITTFVGMYLMGFSLNLMSLTSLSLVVGILVDDAIVVIENIYRHMEMGKNRVRAALEGAKEIGFTVISITLVIVVVFLPISLAQGMVVNILREFTLVVVIAVLVSLLVSFTIVPWLTSRYGKIETLSKTSLYGRFIGGFEAKLQQFTKWVSGILNWSLDHKFITLTIVGVLFFGSFGLISGKFIQFEFMPEGDRGEFLVQIELPKDAALEQTNLMTQKAEEFLSKKSEVVSLISTVGQSSASMGATLSPKYQSEITVQLVDKSKRKDPADIYAAKIKQELEKVLVGAKVKTVPISLVGTAADSPVQMIVTGTDLDSVSTYAEDALALLSSISGVTEAKISVESGNPEVSVKVDRKKMAALGLSIQSVGTTMQIAFNGNTDNKYQDGDYEYDINLRFDDFNRRSIEDVKNIKIINNQGELIELSQFADIREGSGPSQLERYGKSTSIKVMSQVVGRPASAVVSDMEAQLGAISVPNGVSYVWGGDQERQGEGFGSLLTALVISVFLIYFIMVALYDDFVHPLVILFSVPLSIIGALLALALTNNSLNIFTLLGLIMLIGLVAKNAIILVDFTNQMKKSGLSTRESLLSANQARLRPILMTTIAMAIGMLPIAMASGPGAELKNGLAWVVIGGLLSSLFLTLIVVPVVYQLFENIVNKLGLKKEKLDIDKMAIEPYLQENTNNN